MLLNQLIGLVVARALDISFGDQARQHALQKSRLGAIHPKLSIREVKLRHFGDK